MLCDSNTILLDEVLLNLLTKNDKTIVCGPIFRTANCQRRSSFLNVSRENQDKDHQNTGAAFK